MILAEASVSLCRRAACWAHGEVDPVAASLVALDEELIVVALRTVSDIQQDRGIADGLFKSRHTDIHSAARQVVRGRDTTHRLIHRRAPVAAIDDNRLIKVPLAMY